MTQLIKLKEGDPSSINIFVKVCQQELVLAHTLLRLKLILVKKTLKEIAEPPLLWILRE
jgi:hypothetical protein